MTSDPTDPRVQAAPSAWPPSLRPALGCLFAGLLLPVLVPMRAATLELRDAVVVAPAGGSGPEKKAVTMLVEEVEKRSGVSWAR